MPELINTSSGSVRDLYREAERGELYAVLDACDAPAALERVRTLPPEQAASLYRGAAETDLAAIAPYLVRADPLLLEWIAATLWTDPWGILAISTAGFDAVRTHFRKFLLVEAPDGDTWYFRFYDPRVLARFLPTCDAPQLADFFGPLSRVGWTDPATSGVTLVTQQWIDTSAQGRPRITFRAP